jgi:hypothetical protein
LLFVATFALVTASAFPRPQDWATAPALFPLAVAAALAFIVVVVIARTLRARAARDHRPATNEPSISLTDADSAKQRHGTATTLFLILGAYIFVLLPALRFEAATTIFLLFSMVAAERRLPSLGRLIFFAVLPPIFVLLLSGGFGLPLPGNSLMAAPVYEWFSGSGR